MNLKEVAPGYEEERIWALSYHFKQLIVGLQAYYALRINFYKLSKSATILKIKLIRIQLPL